MGEVWITDASPLIALAKVGESRLLIGLPDELLIPEAVAEEILAGPSDDPARKLLIAGFGQLVSPTTIPEQVKVFGLGRGETELLALGLEHPNVRVVVDDAASRRRAVELGVQMIGTLGVVIRATRLGRTESAAAVFHSLRAAGFHVNDATAKRVLQEVGESSREQDHERSETKQ